MAYGMGGGNRNYDPSLKGLPSNSFVGIDGELSDVEVADLTPDEGGPIMRSSWHVGRAVKPDNVPTKLRRTGPPVSRAKLLDVNAQTGSLDLVCQTFKDIVEEFEPDVHQFFPMTYYNSKGTEVIGEGYLLLSANGFLRCTKRYVFLRLMSVGVTNPPLLKKVLISKNGTRALIVRCIPPVKLVADTCGAILRMLVHSCFLTRWASD
jgi:hypothetical protein